MQKAVRDLVRALDPLRQARQVVFSEDRRDRKHGTVGTQFRRTADRNGSGPPEVTSVTLLVATRSRSEFSDDALLQ